MPPIMGAAAFVMAEFLAVLLRAGHRLWAILPAFLYYVAVFFGGALRGQALRAGRACRRAELPRLWRVMLERGHLFLP